jgi:putative resolvase
VLTHQTRVLCFAEELAPDGLEISTVFSARLYGSRRHKHRKVREALGEAAEQR